MNRKFVSRVILPILIIVELSFLFLTYMSYSNKNVDEIKEISKIDKKMFSMYVMNKNTGEYEEVTDNYWPSGNYILDTTKSSCVDNKSNAVSTDELTYNNGKITISSNQTLFCYLYFDIKPDITINVTTNGVSGLPTINKYKAELICNDATTMWNNKYQRIEFNTVTSDEVKCNLDYTKDTNTYTTLKSKVESVNTTNNNGYRYSGKQPNNWVWFNGEKWRIIGSIPVTESDGIETNLVKIIRANSIGNGLSLSFDVNEIYSYYTLLNTKYYGKKDATGSNPCIVHSPFNNVSMSVLCNYKEIGISNLSTDYYGRMIKDVYWNVGTVSSSMTAIATAYTTEAGTKSSVTGKIGLMNASDYGYATSGITYSSVNLGSYSGNTSTINANNNWLYGQGREFTLTQMYVDSSGNVFHDNSCSNCGYAVRPVLYLDSSVYIISGDGTEGNPYQIGM